jgi:uncharacterized membrane protein
MAKKKNDWIYYAAGFLLIFGISGLIYGMLPYTLIIGAVSTIIAFIFLIVIVTKRKHKR